MRQALHIFRNDVLALRIEIGALMLFVALYEWAATSWSVALLELAAVCLIARAVQADSIPGDRQFWLTRPYRRASLAIAKLLFALLCVGLPIGCAQIVILWRAGFSLPDAIPALFSSQAILFVAGALPIFALASLTSTILPFLLSTLLLAIAYLGADVDLAARWSRLVSPTPAAGGWVRNLIVAGVIAAVAAFVVFRQYRYRSTTSGRVIAFAGFDLAVLLFLCLPQSLVFRVQEGLSREPALAGAVSVSLEDLKGPFLSGRGDVARIPMLIRAGGVAKELELRADAVSVSFEWPDGIWRPSRAPGVNRQETAGCGAAFLSAVQMDPMLLRERRYKAVTIRGSIHLTLFGNEEQRTASLRNGPANFQDGLQCEARSIGFSADTLICQSFLRWPARLVYARSGQSEAELGNSLISYSPFPATLDLEPFVRHWGQPVATDVITIVTKQPLVHFTRDFEMRNIVLAEYENVWKPRK